MIGDWMSRLVRSSGTCRTGVARGGVFAGAFIAISVCVGCSTPVVSNLNGEPARKPRSAPFALVARLERLEGPSNLSSDHEAYLERAFTAALKDANVFKAVIYPAGGWAETDITLQGRVEETWPSTGGENFVTHFPGGLIFMPLWKGLKYPFEARATIEVIDSKTGRKVRDYSAATSQMFVHKSGNPAHFLGAAAVIPAVVRGLVVGHPNGNRREMIRREAYADLWTAMASQMAESKIEVEPHAKPSTPNAPPDSAKDDSCGSRRDAFPAVGENWEQYRSCQSTIFRLSGQVAVPQGVASVFQDDRSDGIVVRVVDGKVLSWERKGR